MPNQYTVGTDVPWRDKEKLAEAYHGERTVGEIADEWGCAPDTIHRWVDKHDIERQESYGGEWTDRQTLLELYWGEGLSQSEIAEQLGCNQATISDWFTKHEIPARYLSKEYGQVSTTEDGYEYFCVDCQLVWVHQLVAIAHGADPAKVWSGKEYNTHHKNGIPWDNRPENVELLTTAEHTDKHREELVAARHG